MSIMNPLPPQAYTKDTLVQAYAWLQGQSENIKELATTPDVLVSLYLKAKLQGDGALERPSIQNFKNELKNLAGMMGEFEVVDSQSSSHSAASQDVAISTIRFRSQNLKSNEKTVQSGAIPAAPGPTVQASHSHQYQQSQQPQYQPPPAAQSHHHSHSNQAPPMPPETPSHSSRTSESQRMDFRSLDMIQEVKSQFNLSSDTEAMRLLIAVGYNQVKNLLK